MYFISRFFIDPWNSQEFAGISVEPKFRLGPSLSASRRMKLKHKAFLFNRGKNVPFNRYISMLIMAHARRYLTAVAPRFLCHSWQSTTECAVVWSPPLALSAANSYNPFACCNRETTLLSMCAPLSAVRRDVPIGELKPAIIGVLPSYTDKGEWKSSIRYCQKLHVTSTRWVNVSQLHKCPSRAR